MNKKTLPPWPIESCSVLSAMIGSAMGIPKVFGELHAVALMSRWNHVRKTLVRLVDWPALVAKSTPQKHMQRHVNTATFSAPNPEKKEALFYLMGFSAWHVSSCFTATLSHPNIHQGRPLESDWIFSCAENSFLDLGVEVQIGVTNSRLQGSVAMQRGRSQVPRWSWWWSNHPIIFGEMCSESCVILAEICPSPKKSSPIKENSFDGKLLGIHSKEIKLITQRDKFPSPSVWFAEELDAKLQRFSARAESGSSLSCKFLGEFLGGVACLWTRVVVLSMLLSLQFLFFQFLHVWLYHQMKKIPVKRCCPNRWIWHVKTHTSYVISQVVTWPTLVAMWLRQASSIKRRVRPTGIMIQWMTRRGKIWKIRVGTFLEENQEQKVSVAVVD